MQQRVAQQAKDMLTTSKDMNAGIPKYQAAAQAAAARAAYDALPAWQPPPPPVR